MIFLRFWPFEAHFPINIFLSKNMYTNKKQYQNEFANIEQNQKK